MPEPVHTDSKLAPPQTGAAISAALIRALDLVLAGGALLALAPLLGLVALILKCTGEHDVFYRQARVGRGGRDFPLLKFATMLRDSPGMGTGLLTVENDPRVFPFGGLLRKTKLNEIPQLWNVVAGDMSLIGPRPLARRHFDLYPAALRERIAAGRPGLSGIGSIVFRDEEAIVGTAADRVKFYETVVQRYKGELEAWASDRRSVRLYLALIFLTIWAVLRPGSDLPQRWFADLPKPPPELRALL
jgi:lipopolysaccharide/colanic/teichoic acid biosynthesis glycosyltransferase